MDYFASFDPAAETERITGFIRATFETAQKSTAVIAVSGGIDSSLSLALTVKALGPNAVHTYYLPSKVNTVQNHEDARSAVEAANLPADHFHTVHLGSIIQKTWRIIKHYTNKDVDLGVFGAQISEAALKPAHGTRAPQNTESTSSKSEDEARVNRLRLANLTARARMMVIYDQAKKLDSLVVGTENYSEHLLGYFTRFGDEAADLEPIRHLYKTEVVKLAHSLALPKQIIEKPPSADLWRGQTDENELGFSYTAADPILYLLDQGKLKAEIIAAGFPEPLVSAVVKQVHTSTFKHQVPYHL